jgi:hypothetical protein
MSENTKTMSAFFKINLKGDNNVNDAYQKVKEINLGKIRTYHKVIKESDDTLTLLFNASFNDEVPFELDTIKN